MKKTISLLASLILVFTSSVSYAQFGGLLKDLKSLAEKAQQPQQVQQQPQQVQQQLQQVQQQPQVQQNLPQPSTTDGKSTPITSAGSANRPKNDRDYCEKLKSSKAVETFGEQIESLRAHIADYSNRPTRNSGELRTLTSQANYIYNMGFDDSQFETTKILLARINKAVPKKDSYNQDVVINNYMGWFVPCAIELLKTSSNRRFIFINPFDSTANNSSLQAMMGQPGLGGLTARKITEDTGISYGGINPRWVIPLAIAMSTDDINIEGRETNIIERASELKSRVVASIDRIKTEEAEKAAKAESLRSQQLAQRKASEEAYAKAERERAAESQKEQREREEEYKKLESKLAAASAYMESTDGRLVRAYQHFQVINLCHDLRKDHVIKFISSADYSVYRDKIKTIESKLKPQLSQINTDSLYSQAEERNRNTQIGYPDLLEKDKGFDMLKMITNAAKGSDWLNAKEGCENYAAGFRKIIEKNLGTEPVKKNF
jgi:hypothetical protein